MDVTTTQGGIQETSMIGVWDKTWHTVCSVVWRAVRQRSEWGRLLADCTTGSNTGLHWTGEILLEILHSHAVWRHSSGTAALWWRRGPTRGRGRAAPCLQIFSYTSLRYCYSLFVSTKLSWTSPAARSGSWCWPGTGPPPSPASSPRSSRRTTPSLETIRAGNSCWRSGYFSAGL